MSHVISSQPSLTSPYQPTATQEQGKNAATQNTFTLGEGSQDTGCCFRADKSQGCCLYNICRVLSSFSQSIANCTESCCNCISDCLVDCCEDKPDDRRKSYNPRNYDNGYSDDNTWAIDVEPLAGWEASGGDDSNNTHHVSENHFTVHHTRHGDDDFTGHQSSGCHDSGVHHSSSNHETSAHDTGHHSVCHDSGGHDSGGHDSGGHDSGGHDSGGGGYDGGCDAGDSGGGCDSGGGGCDD